MNRLVRASLRIVGIALVLAVALAMPGKVAACTCGELVDGSVVFTGSATGGPVGGTFGPTAGVYQFAVDGVTHGDPGDGRVFTPFPFGGCGRTFEIGARYEVHARVVDPDAVYRPSGLIPRARLTTTSCMAGGLLAPAPSSSWQPLPAAGVVAGLAVLGAGIAIVWIHRRRRGAPERR